MTFLRSILVLGRVSNLPTIWANVIAAWIVAGGGWTIGLVWAGIAGSLLYVGGMTLNDAFDANWDREHGKDRPISTGKININTVWILGTAWMWAGGAIFVFVAGAFWGWVIGLVAAIVLYNLLHKKFASSMWIMGLCRGLLFVTAATCASDSLVPSQNVIFWAIALLAYTAGITYAARGEDTQQPMNVRALAAILLFFPLLLGIVMFAKFPALWTEARIGVIALFLAWLAVSYSKLPKIGAFVSSLIAGMVLIDAIAVSTYSLGGAALCAAGLPLCLLLQKFIPAT
ncbi:MAG: hypothetical protein ACI8UO_000669 [Verrucomicrobiales bacterium]|jgi:hypothetical protein